MVNLLKKWSAQKQTTPAQISLAWLLHQKPWIVPIPGTTQMVHMLENIGAENIKFTSNQIQEFNTEMKAITIKGERLPAAVLQYSNVEAPIKK